MSGEGPTTVGSIVGKLKMDRSQWVAMMAATKSDIRELETADPDIHIDVNAAEAISKLNATAAAASALGAKQDELGRKTKKTTEETIKANDANRTAFTRVGAIVTAIALLVPLLAPVGAAAIGVGSAFLGMGAAGILALVGINREMQDGTAVGGAYRDGVDSLKDSMGTLARTAAVNMLQSFRRVVTETRDALPGLNTQVGQFSTLLGRSGANLFTGTINSLRILNPLFVTAGLYIQSLTEGFQRWTESDGINKFGDYAMSALPQVVDVLGKLTSMVMHLLQALAPLGTIGLAALGGISDIINSIPIDVLTQLIVTITWGAIAFKAWGFIAPMLATIATSMGAVGVATTIATGPIGWVVAGLAALAGVLAVVIARNQTATAGVMEYTAAVEADTGAIGENVRAKAAQQLQEAGVLASAKQLGISLETVTNATLGEASALKELSLYTKAADGDQASLNQIMKDTGLNIYEVVGLLDSMVTGLRTESATITDTVKGWELRTEAMKQSTGVTRQQQAADEAAAAALGITVGALQAARGSQGDLEESTAKATAEMYVQGDAAGLLKQKLDELNGKALSAAEAQNRFESQLVGMTGAIARNGTELSGLSEGAIANRGALLGLIQSSQDAVVALRDQGAEESVVQQKFAESKRAIIDQAVANGVNRDAVTAYVDELYKIPASVPKTKVEVELETARAQLAAFFAEISARRATIAVRAVTSVESGVERHGGARGGGTMPGLAGGGGGTVTGPGNAHSDTAGLFRLANSEEVISNQFGQADRNRSLLKAINAGFTPSQAAAGNARAASLSDAAPQTIKREAPIVNVNVTTVQNENPEVLARIIGGEVKRVLAGRG